MTEEDWTIVLRVFAASRSQRGDKGRNDRKFLEALHYFVVHNITWRALPYSGTGTGEASALRTVMDALRRERKLYEFAPVWFETGEVANLSAELIRKKDQGAAAAKAKTEIDAERNKQLVFRSHQRIPKSA